MKNIAYSSLMDATLNLNSTSFINQRDQLETILIGNLQKKFDEKTKKLVRVKAVYVLNIEFEKEFEDASAQKVLESIESKISEIQKNASVINETLSKNSVLNDAKIYLSISDVLAYEKKQLKIAHGEALKKIIIADSDAYKAVDDVFSFSYDNNLINFILAVEGSSISANQFVNYRSAIAMTTVSTK